MTLNSRRPQHAYILQEKEKLGLPTSSSVLLSDPCLISQLTTIALQTLSLPTHLQALR